MVPIPVIIGLGGVNPAGRSSQHHAYRRLVLECLPPSAAESTLSALAALTGRLRWEDGRWHGVQGPITDLSAYLDLHRSALLADTGVRRLDSVDFNPHQVAYQRKTWLNASPTAPIEFISDLRDLPTPLPGDWQVSPMDDGRGDKVRVKVTAPLDVLLPAQRSLGVSCAGQLPTGFDPQRLYPARSHPRGLQMTIFGASDALGATGLDWERIRQRVAPDQIAVYAGSGLGQLDYDGLGGLLKARQTGRKVSSKQLPLGYAEMPADFINAYVLGNLGTTGTQVAACATFLYNLRQAVRDIQTGTHRLALVGTSEAPIVPEVIDGFATMGALADDAALRALDGLPESATIDHRRACRPFGHNAGFTLAEAAQFVVLCDDALALELGADILGGVNAVYVNADGHKKSITSPGLGNYLSMAKATAATRAVIGDTALRQRTFVQAHGTGTPQNRTTESHILSQVAAQFGIESWPVTAVKAYVGHSLASAAGDQVAATLGLWQYGWIPGITTTHTLADDVTTAHLDFLLTHREVGTDGIDAVLLNAKGFGGNNATASVLAPSVVERLMTVRHGAAAMSAWRQRREATREASATHDQEMTRGSRVPLYRFDHEVRDGAHLRWGNGSLTIEGFELPVNLDLPNPYGGEA